MEREKQLLIEITEEEKNIVLYCVEKCYYRDKYNHNLREKITKALLEKLIAKKRRI